MTISDIVLAAGGSGIVYPVDLAPVSMAAPTAQDTFPATYSTLVASTAAHFICCGVQVCIPRTLGSPLTGYAELATGAASSEVVFERFGYGFVVNDATADATYFMHQSQLLNPFYIPSGTRLSGRQAQDHASAWTSCPTYFYGFNVPSPSIAARVLDRMQNLQGHAGKGGDRFPNIGWVTLTHSGTSWVPGAWVQLSASVADDCLVEGAYAGADQNNKHYRIEFGIGGAGSEVLLPAMLPFAGFAVGQPVSNGLIPCPMPLYVPKGSRLVAREKCISTTGTMRCAAKVSYLK